MHERTIELVNRFNKPTRGDQTESASLVFCRRHSPVDRASDSDATVSNLDSALCTGWINICLLRFKLNSYALWKT